MMSLKRLLFNNAPGVCNQVAEWYRMTIHVHRRMYVKLVSRVETEWEQPWVGSEWTSAKRL